MRTNREQVGVDVGLMTRTLVAGWACLAGAAEVGAQGVVLDDDRSRAVVVRSVELDSGPVLHVFTDPSRGQALPAVVFVLGYPDDALSIGPLNETEHYRSWARLVAARGMAAVLYTTSMPAHDVSAVMSALAARGHEFGVDGSRLALWVASGNGPVAVGYLRDPARVDLQAVAALYAVLPSAEGFMAEELRTMSTRQGYVLPVGDPNARLPTDVPILVVRPGRDHPLLLRLMDRFSAWGQEQGAQIRMLRYAEGGHAFDSREDSDGSRAVVEEVLSFLSTELGVGP